MKSSPPGRRLLEADLLRVAAMISVVVVHTVAWMNLNGTGAAVIYPFLDRFMRFGVPIFVFLLGYVLVAPNRHKRFDPWRFFSRRFRRVLAPFLSWELIYVGIYAAVGLASIGSFRDAIEVIWNGSVGGHLYFLVVACQLYLLYMVFPRSRRAAVGLLIFALPFQLILTAFRAGGWHPAGFLDVLVNSNPQWFGIWWIGYYALGVAAAWYREELIEWLSGHRILVLLSASVAILLAISEMVNSGVQGYDEFFRPTTCLLSLAVIAALMSIAPLLEKYSYIGSKLELLSQRSLGVYMLHPLMLILVAHFVNSRWTPMGFSGPLILTLPTFIFVVTAVLVISLVIVGVGSWIPAAWILGGCKEARIRIQGRKKSTELSSAA